MKKDSSPNKSLTKEKTKSKSGGLPKKVGLDQNLLQTKGRPQQLQNQN